MIDLIHIEDLARRMGYAAPNAAFRAWCNAMRIEPVPGRRGYYDPQLVRRRLDEAQGLHEAAQPDGGGMSLVAQRRARRAEG